jgi:flavin reductase (DIM6/NTAB) family NADH-FMN oxidoreductase RutF
MKNKISTSPTSQKETLGAKMLVPMGLIVLVGSKVDNKPNYNTIGNFGNLESKPPTIYVAMDPEHYTFRGILRNMTFSVNIPTKYLVQETDYCGLVSGHEVDKSDVFKTFYGVLLTAPMILECPLNFECKVINELSHLNKGIVAGEVKEVYCNRDIISLNEKNEKIPDIAQIPLLFCSILDLKYWILKEPIAEAFSVGKDYKRS